MDLFRLSQKTHYSFPPPPTFIMVYAGVQNAIEFFEVEEYFFSDNKTDLLTR